MTNDPHNKSERDHTAEEKWLTEDLELAAYEMGRIALHFAHACPTFELTVKQKVAMLDRIQSECIAILKEDPALEELQANVQKRILS